MAGENTVLSYGNQSYRVKAARFMFGPNIISTEDHGQGGVNYGGWGSRAIYIRQWFMSTFSVAVMMSTWEDREAFVNWCIAYAQFISNPNNGIGPLPMRVQGPRGFDFYGILTTGFDRTNAVTDLVYTLNLVFQGGQRTPAVGVQLFSGFSGFQAPQASDSANQYFYPDSKQLKAGQSAEDTLYGTPLDATEGLATTSVIDVSGAPISTSIPNHPGKGEA